MSKYNATAQTMLQINGHCVMSDETIYIRYPIIAGFIPEYKCMLEFCVTRYVSGLMPFNAVYTYV